MMNFEDLTPAKRIADENEDEAAVKKIKGVVGLETEGEIFDFVWKILKKDDRKADAMTFMVEFNDCHSVEVLRELAERYVGKPRLR